jgi:hypothetical protein
VWGSLSSCAPVAYRRTIDNRTYKRGCLTLESREQARSGSSFRFERHHVIRVLIHLAPGIRPLRYRREPRSAPDRVPQSNAECSQDARAGLPITAPSVSIAASFANWPAFLTAPPLWAGLEYNTGFVTSGPHGFDDGWVGVIQIDEDVARITILRGRPSTSPSSSPLGPWR